MATRHGYEYGLELVQKHGWRWSETDEETYGDRWVIDPITGTVHNPYEARQIQAKRDTIETQTESPRGHV